MLVTSRREREELRVLNAQVKEFLFLLEDMGRTIEGDQAKDT
jgi:hypothetical protein